MESQEVRNVGGDKAWKKEVREAKEKEEQKKRHLAWHTDEKEEIRLRRQFGDVNGSCREREKRTREEEGTKRQKECRRKRRREDERDRGSVGRKKKNGQRDLESVERQEKEATERQRKCSKNK